MEHSGFKALAIWQLGGQIKRLRSLGVGMAGESRQSVRVLSSQ